MRDARLRSVLSMLIVLAAMVTAGCGSTGPMLSVLRGNLAYSRGDYQSALVHYLATDETSDDRGWILFNTGNVYYALGEQEAALSSWDQARQAAGSLEDGGSGAGRATMLIHAASYNRGVLFYQRGEYRSAYDEFRYALAVNSQSVPAKANLELALQKIRAAEQAQQMGGNEVAEDDGEATGPATLRILEYVRRKETQRWFANRELDESDDPRDW